MTTFSVETANLQSAMAICGSVMGKGFSADKLIFSPGKNSISLKAFAPKEKISVMVEEVPSEVNAKNAISDYNFALMNCKIDVMQNALKLCSAQDTQLDFDVESKLLTINKKFSFCGLAKISKEGQPSFPSSGEGKKLFEIDADVLAGMFQKISPLKEDAEKDDRAQTIIFEVEENNLKIISGFGAACAIAENELHAANCKFILPLNCVSILKKFIVNRQSDDLIEVRQLDGKIKFVQRSIFTTSIFTTSITIATKEKSMLEHYKKLFSAEIFGKMTAPTLNLKKVLNRVSCIARSTDGVNFFEVEGNLKAELFSIDNGMAEEFTKATFDGEVNFLVNARRLLKIISAIQSTNTTIENAENAITITGDKVKYFMCKQKEIEAFAGKNFTQKTLILERNAKIDCIYSEMRHEIYQAEDKTKSETDEQQAEFNKLQDAKKQFDDSIEGMATDTVITSAVKEELKEQAETELKTAKAHFERFIKLANYKLAKEQEKIGAMAEQKRKEIEARYAELIANAA